MYKQKIELYVCDFNSFFNQCEIGLPQKILLFITFVLEVCKQIRNIYTDDRMSYRKFFFLVAGCNFTLATKWSFKFQIPNSVIWQNLVVLSFVRVA